MFKTASLTISDNVGFKLKSVNDKNHELCTFGYPTISQSTCASPKEPEETELAKPRYCTQNTDCIAR